jgi:hypothetical protein
VAAGLWDSRESWEEENRAAAGLRDLRDGGGKKRNETFF